ncbi:MAG: hypothetical protein AAF687_04400 [Pseudomonadota bacterium]
MDTLLIAKILLTLVAALQCIGPIKADFNDTHATNPHWTAHARFHVVWQVLTQSGISILALALIWIFPSEFNLWLAAIINFNWLVTFFVTLSSMPLYEGALKDANGIKPFKFNIGGKIREVDTNLFGACFLSLFNIAAVVLLLSNPATLAAL